MSKVKRVGIIGGGAAGLFAACQLKQLSAGSDIEVTILEKNPVPGIKLTLTGHGRCNITNRKDAADLKKGFHEAENFVYPAIREFGPEDAMRFVTDKLGLKLKEEENNRVFPVCDSAVKVRDAIVSYISGTSKTLTSTTVLSITHPSDFEVTTDKGSYRFDYVILSCGGSSFTKTGSAGDSYRFAGSLGHTVSSARAALAPVRAGRDSVGLCKRLSGVSVAASASLYHEGKKTASMNGELLFADFGLTGPAVMELSREIPLEIKDTFIELDMTPDLSDEEYDKELQKLINDHPDTKISTLLARSVPASVAGEIAARAGAEGQYAQGFTKDNRKKVCREMKHLKIVIDTVPEIDKAYVTRGGVLLKEVDRKTMGSKLVPGLYIIGEALDVDGISGGYNLQACMSEAYLAAKSIIQS